jgi:hypothetical protein
MENELKNAKSAFQIIEDYVNDRIQLIQDVRVGARGETALILEGEERALTNVSDYIGMLLGKGSKCNKV